jgi:hypothetical protein
MSESIYLRMLWWLWIIYWKGCVKKWPWPDCKLLAGELIWRDWWNLLKACQDIRSLSQDLTWRPPESISELLPLDSSFPVNKLWAYSQIEREFIPRRITLSLTINTFECPLTCQWQMYELMRWIHVMALKLHFLGTQEMGVEILQGETEVRLLTTE